MAFRVPLLFPSAIVVERLDHKQTRAIDPPGTQTEGYDPDFREPVPYEEDVSGTPKVKNTRRYLPPIRVPCQVEVKTYEEIRQVFVGDAPIVNMIFVLHRRDLQRLGLLGKAGDSCTGCPTGVGVKLKTNDKITAIEKLGVPGRVTQPLKETLFVVEIQPASWGMGPDGLDLHLLFVNNRPAQPSAGGG